jgi:hypothetical protein
LPDVEHPGRPINILPAKGKQFPSTQSTCQRQRVQRIVGILTHCNKESTRLIHIEDSHLTMSLLWQLDGINDVMVN